MATPRDESRGRLIRVQGPALPVVTLVSGSIPPAPVCELIRVQGPALPVVTLVSGPPAPVATVHLRRPLADGDDVPKIESRLRALVAKVNEVEAIFERPGVSLDEARSGVRAGEVVLVLVPSDAADPLSAAKRIADLLFSVVRDTAGSTLKVFTADQPNTPVYELAV